MEENLTCVVGRCLQPMDQVKRCYWGIQWEVTDNAYLDLCKGHQMVLGSKNVSALVEGWNPLDPDVRYDRHYNYDDPDAFARCKGSGGCGPYLFSCSGLCLEG